MGRTGYGAFPEETFGRYKTKSSAHSKTKEGFRRYTYRPLFPEDNAPTRKPRTGLLTHYLKGDYDLANSFVVGDRETDVQLAENMHCKAIFLSDEPHPKAVLSTTDWGEIYRFLKAEPRKGTATRKTSETDIRVEVNLDGTGKSRISTGLGF